MDEPMAEVIKDEDLIYIKSLLFDREIADDRPAYLQAMSSNSSSIADTLSIARIVACSRDLVEGSYKTDDDDDDDDSDGSSLQLFTHFRIADDSTNISQDTWTEKIEHWLATNDSKDPFLYE
jgi:hypothetical protein